MKKLFLLLCCAFSLAVANAQENVLFPEVSNVYAEINGSDGYYNNNGKWEKNMNMINCLQNYFGKYEVRTIMCNGNNYYMLLSYHPDVTMSESMEQYLTNQVVIDYYLIDEKEYMNNVSKIDPTKVATTKFTILKEGTANTVNEIEAQCKNICDTKLTAGKKTSYLVYQTQFMKGSDMARFLFFKTTYSNNKYSNPFPAGCGVSTVFMTKDIFTKAYFQTDYNTLYNFIFLK